MHLPAHIAYIETAQDVVPRKTGSWDQARVGTRLFLDGSTSLNDVPGVLWLRPSRCGPSSASCGGSAGDEHDDAHEAAAVALSAPGTVLHGPRHAPKGAGEPRGRQGPACVRVGHTEALVAALRDAGTAHRAWSKRSRSSRRTGARTCRPRRLRRAESVVPGRARVLVARRGRVPGRAPRPGALAGERGP